MKCQDRPVDGVSYVTENASTRRKTSSSPCPKAISEKSKEKQTRLATRATPQLALQPTKPPTSLLLITILQSSTRSLPKIEPREPICKKTVAQNASSRSSRSFLPRSIPLFSRTRVNHQVQAPRAATRTFVLNPTFSVSENLDQAMVLYRNPSKTRRSI